MESEPSASLEIPTDFRYLKKKRPKVTNFTVNEKNMIINMYKYVKETWPIDKYPYKNEMMQKVADILGIGIASVYRISKEFKEHGQFLSPVLTKSRPTYSDEIDDFTKSAIRRKVHALFLKGEHTSVKQVLNHINEDDTLPNFKLTTFRKILKNLKCSVKGSSEDILEEQDHLTHTDYHCHECVGDIVGFRYLCVQCADFDMCAACEARGAHAHHYMLRVPSDSTHHEATTILATIRQIINVEKQENHEVPIETESFKSDTGNDALEGETTVKVEPQEPGELELTLYPDAHDTVASDAETVQENAQTAEPKEREQCRKRRAADTKPVKLPDTQIKLSLDQITEVISKRSKTVNKSQSQVSVRSLSNINVPTRPTQEVSLFLPNIPAPMSLIPASNTVPIIMYNIPNSTDVLADQVQAVASSSSPVTFEPSQPVKDIIIKTELPD